MKAIKVIILFLLLPSCVHSQVDILSDMQGLSDQGNFVFEVEGYTIVVEKNYVGLDDKGIRSLKKKYELKDIISEGKDSRWKWQNYRIESRGIDKKVPEVINYQLCYLIPEADDRMTTVMFTSPNRKDTLLEQSFMKAFFERELLKYLNDDWAAENINFAGRRIKLGNICSWVSPCNVHCPTFGQISWSTFRRKEDALINNQAYELINKESGIYKVQKEEQIDVIFEDIPTQAKRVFYKLNRSKMLLGGRNIMAVYYIVQKVRGKYISCVLSHYVEDKNNYKLSSLLQEVMSLTE